MGVGGGGIHGSLRHTEKLLRRETKGEKYSSAEKKDKQGEITGAVRWKLVKTCQISLNFHKAHIRAVLRSYRILFMFVCVRALLPVFTALTENKCHQITLQSRIRLKKKKQSKIKAVGG